MDDRALSAKESFIAAELWMDRASAFYLASMCAAVVAILSLLIGSMLSPLPLHPGPFFILCAQVAALVCPACAYATWYCNRRLKKALADL